MKITYDRFDDETLFTDVFVIEDDSYAGLGFSQKDTLRKGPMPNLSHSEVITLEFMTELKGVNSQ